MSEIADALRGNKLEEVHSRADRRAVSITAGGTVLFSVEGVLAVANEDGCRVATREERESGRGPSSLLDRLFARVR